MIRTDAQDIVATIEGHPGYKRYQELTSQREDLSVKARLMERKWVKCQRLQRELETVALAANLHLTASDEIQERYRGLVAAEAGTLAGGR